MAAAENHLIELLPAKERQSLLSIAEMVQLSAAQVLGNVGKPTRYVYFPVDSFVSTLSSINGKPVLEVGMVGREGFIGAHVALHVLTQPLHTLVQGPGRAWRVQVGAFGLKLRGSVPLQRLLERYLYVSMSQLAASAGCAHTHQIDTRLGRWLLMMQDRAHADTFTVTHESLAYMLGVRRVSITIAAVALQRKGFIQYSRGRIAVVSRQGLETAACGCYGADNEVYARFMK